MYKIALCTDTIIIAMRNTQIQAPPGNTIGFVNQCWTCIKPKYVYHSITNIPSPFHLPFLYHKPLIILIEPQTCHVFQVTLIINIHRFEITDGDGNVALKILGPWCTYSCAGDVEFKVVETLVDELPFFCISLCKFSAAALCSVPSFCFCKLR